jgi:glycyl-tRNA synthetase
VLPLSKKLEDVARPVYEELCKYFMVEYDAAGSIGKRYRREDEIGTPFCICVDFDTAETGKVTVRDRDTMQQELVAVDDLVSWLEAKIDF